MPPDEAGLGVSAAVGAVAETGTVVLSSEEGRRLQLLPPTHLVVLSGNDVYPTLGEALAALRASGSGLPAAVGLHSGPSKSADIGMVTVTGVHGPGRLVVLLIEEDTKTP